jgi:hypothetical protein
MLVVMLVAASFLGGAFVNGPGLRWAQVHLLRSFGLGEAGEIASVDLTAATSPEAASNGSAPAKGASTMTHGSSDRGLALAAMDEPSEQLVSDRGASSPARPNVKDAKVGSGPGQSPPSRSSIAAPPVAKNSSPVARASLEQPVNAATTPAAPPGKSRLRDPEIAPVASNTAGLPGFSSLAVEGSSAASLQPPAAQMSVMGRGDEWAALQRTMQSLGVTRFTIEAEPGGHVVCTCLIPLAGAQAVAQRFEAEGDDVMQVTRAALRRITLWQATQVPSR